MRLPDFITTGSLALPRTAMLRSVVGLYLLQVLWAVKSYDTTFAFDRPLQSAVLSCLIAGAILVLLGRFGIRAFGPDSQPTGYSEIPLVEPSQTSSSSSPKQEYFSVRVRGYRISFAPIRLVEIGLILLRVALLRHMTLNDQCIRSESAYAIPLLLAIYSHVRQRRQILGLKVQSRSEWHRPAVQSTSEGSWQLSMSAALLYLAGYLTSSLNESRSTTYICFPVAGGVLRMQLLQIVTVLLDVALIAYATEILLSKSEVGRENEALAHWGWALLVAGAIWGGQIMASSALHLPSLSTHLDYYQSVLSVTVLMVTLSATMALTIPRYGILRLSLLAEFIVVSMRLSMFIRAGRYPFPTIPIPWTIAAVIAVAVAAVMFIRADTISDYDSILSQSVGRYALRATAILAAIGLIMTYLGTNTSDMLPIDRLIREGRQQHQEYVKQVRISTNLEDAVSEYRRRYHQHPPPNFDKWYEFATKRNSVIIDDFDQIYSDLLPFRAISPARLRELTHTLATNPSNEVGAISIRNGNVHIQKDTLPTHRWMVEGAVKMMEPFVEHLPDMDLVFNLNDEPRLAVPWETLLHLREEASSSKISDKRVVRNRWSVDRKAGWKSIEPRDQNRDPLFTDYSKSPTWDAVRHICPSSSPARSRSFWVKHRLCLGCIWPHSLGQFVSNWTAAGDICHQPDLQHLHGFFISPSDAKLSTQLLPVFSQSKVQGFADILFPSPWNYVDKVTYGPSKERPDVPYMKKEKELFWLGRTTEGYSISGEWQGMTRQRMAHLMTNNKQGSITMLMRKAAKDKSYSYQVLKGVEPRERYGLRVNVSIGKPVDRCSDCQVQEAQLNATDTTIDFQDHWRSRFLFDMDGAGFSGRFIPFLQSRSLPFRTALFRTWIDSRLTAWYHFVPQDLRLHDVWSTFGYFAGVRDGLGGTLMEPHHHEGERIAEQGREWAHKVLRKEDMEIYFFRLLLEWGRLTDDDRDTIGFMT